MNAIHFCSQWQPCIQHGFNSMYIWRAYLTYHVFDLPVISELQEGVLNSVERKKCKFVR